MRIQNTERRIQTTNITRCSFMIPAFRIMRIQDSEFRIQTTNITRYSFMIPAFRILNSEF